MDDAIIAGENEEPDLAQEKEKEAQDPDSSGVDPAILELMNKAGADKETYDAEEAWQQERKERYAMEKYEHDRYEEEEQERYGDNNQRYDQGYNNDITQIEQLPLKHSKSEK